MKGPRISSAPAAVLLDGLYATLGTPRRAGWRKPIPDREYIMDAAPIISVCAGKRLRRRRRGKRKELARSA